MNARLSTGRVTATLLIAGIGAVGLGTAPSAAEESPLGTPAATTFYVPPTPLPDVAAGTVLRSEPITYRGDVADVTATRIMYASQDNNQDPVAVTGTVIVPDAAWTGPGKRPVVAYAPATVGLGPQCVMSLTMGGAGTNDLSSNLQRDMVDKFLAKGYAVAQTDYQGAGVPGPSPYMSREPQGQNVLDAARAALRLPAAGLSPTNPIGVFGYSQGGGAAAAAAELAATYAPELDIKGVVAGAPPADLLGIAKAAPPGSAPLLGYAFIGSVVAAPEFRTWDLLNDRGQTVMTDLQHTCVGGATAKYGFAKTSNWTADGLDFYDEFNSRPTLKARLAEENLGNTAPAVPVLVDSAWNDDVIPHAVVSKMVDDWCANGAAQVQQWSYWVYAVPTHVWGMQRAANDGATWLEHRFKGHGFAGNAC